MKIFEATIPKGTPITLFYRRSGHGNYMGKIDIISERTITVIADQNPDGFYRYCYTTNPPIYQGKPIRHIRWSELEKGVVYKELSWNL